MWDCLIMSSSGDIVATMSFFVPSRFGRALAVPERWLQYVNKAETESELAALRRSVVRGAPYGDEIWQQQMAAAWVWNRRCGGQADRGRKRKCKPPPELTWPRFQT